MHGLQASPDKKDELARIKLQNGVCFWGGVDECGSLPSSLSLIPLCIHIFKYIKKITYIYIIIVLSLYIYIPISNV